MKSIVFVAILAVMAGLATAQFYPAGNHSVISVPSPYAGQYLFGNVSHARALGKSTCGVTAGTNATFFLITPEPMATMSISISERFTTVSLPVVTVFSNNSRGEFTCVADETADTNSTFSFTAASTPTQYWVMLSNFTSANCTSANCTVTGQFALSLNETAASASLGCASDLKVFGSFSDPIAIFGVLNGTGQRVRANTTFGSHRAWYEIFPTMGMNVSVSTVSLTEDFNTTLSVSYGSCDNQTLLTADALASNATFIATEESYHIFVTGYGNGTSGSYFLNITEQVNYAALPGNSRNNSIRLPGPGLFANQTNEHSANITAACKLAAGHYPAAWYHLSLPSTTDVLLSTCSRTTELDTAILVFAEDGDECIAFNDDFGCDLNPEASEVTISTTDVSRDFLVAVVGFNGTVGAFDLDVRMKRLH